MFNPDNPNEKWGYTKKLSKVKEAKVGDFNLQGYTPEAPKEGADLEIMTGKGHTCKVNYSRVEVYPETRDQHWGSEEYWKEELIGHTFLRYELEVITTAPAIVKKGKSYNGWKVWGSFDMNQEERFDDKAKLPREKVADRFSAVGLSFTDSAELVEANEKFVNMHLTVSFSNFPESRNSLGRDIQVHTITSEAWTAKEDGTVSPPPLPASSGKPNF